MTEDEAAITFYNLMNTHMNARLDLLKKNRRKVAHYTTAENAMNIITGKSIWLRNSALMNDFSEIKYGKERLVDALKRQMAEIDTILGGAHHQLATEIINWLVEVEEPINTHTYLTSFAEHSENDFLGKLSMWRAYGGPVAGVAIVFNTDVFESEEVGQALNAFMYPVLYGQAEFDRHFDQIVANLRSHGDLLEQLPRARVKSVLFHTFQDLVLTTKHPGFAEEEEWRVIFAPPLFGPAHMDKGIHTIAGIPQVVHKIKLGDQSPINLPELELDRLVHRVVVGPCQYPQQVAYALDTALQAAGVKNSRDRILISDIPLRQRG
ncbi:DUF2971 domain-containing protein [Sphingomonas qilianensis]|uniref:DUF2971 domain-containing protein n=1 Tax=Sphingomonas qilianensis TaxID=1736690 RepID=A0ABU9XWB0_9SPHN